MRALLIVLALLASTVNAEMVQIDTKDLIPVADRLAQLRTEHWTHNRDQNRYDELFLMEQMLRKVEKLPEPIVCEKDKDK